MQSIRNKKTGRFLTFSVEAYTYEDYGITESVTSIRKYLELSDSEFPGTVFVTNQEGVIEDLLKDGKSTYPDIRIDFGWNQTKFEISDLEAVTLIARER